MRMKQLRNRGLNQDADFVGKRGAVGKSSGYSPIQKFDTVKLIGNKPTNWTRDEDALPDADEAFEMPSFEHLEGEQWTDSSLQFNNVSNAASGSHLDQWKKENSDWRSDAQTQAQRSQSRGDSVPPLPQPPSSSSVSAPSLPGNPVPEDGVTDEWGRTPGVAFTNPTALQQPAAASSGVPTNPKSPEKLQATPSNAVSWDTGGFDFADMKTDAGNDSEAGGGRNSRVQSRADTRRPSRERKQGRSQESPRGAGATRQVDASDGSNDQRAGAPVDTDQEPADDFESFWNQF